MKRKNAAGKSDDLLTGQRESGLPGGGAGRKDEVSGSGVYPASAGKAPEGAEIRTQGAWGQGDRGLAGYQDAGESELFFYEAELRAADIKAKQDQNEAERSGSYPITKSQSESREKSP